MSWISEELRKNLKVYERMAAAERMAADERPIDYNDDDDDDWSVENKVKENKTLKKVPN